MVPLSVFYPYILHSTLGAPEPLVDLMLLNTAIEFCSESNCVQILQPAISSVVGQADYSIVPPTDMQLSRVLAVWYQGRQLGPVVPDFVDAALAHRSPIASESAPRGTPAAFYQPTPDASTIKLWPVPDTAVTDVLTLRVAFKPAVNATTLPALLHTSWAKGFTAGVRGALHSVPGQPFTDVNRAQIELVEYQKTLRAATIQTNTGNIRGNLRVRPNPLF